MSMLDPNKAIEKLARTMGRMPGLVVEYSVYEPPRWSVYFQISENADGWTALKVVTRAAIPPTGEYPGLEVGLVDVNEDDCLIFGFCNIAEDVDPDEAEATIRALSLLRNRKGGLRTRGRVCLIGD
jgi:hypothetical protein